MNHSATMQLEANAPLWWGVLQKGRTPRNTNTGRVYQEFVHKLFATFGRQLHEFNLDANNIATWPVKTPFGAIRQSASRSD
jgi:hypothetical protein